ncbi:hypothetical protein KI387_013185 [Taxus chinensis]|uniref:J domain-containing protein n=1 Tax=Taxus chinensis TaxID=29808 RepID=A0AA38FH03_TAXCH|nr:hypothetical protein KI387_013185 [Taxus chinensis]
MEDACRGKQVAEKKFEEGDVAGAKRVALKAQQMYPSLQGLSHLIAVLDVHLASAAHDCYAILQVPFGADEGLIKKQYRRLALLLHPDKNKSVGAEEAFKLLAQAWRLLSHPTNRAAYDRTRSPNPSSFWTLCPSCIVRFQFHTEYLNRHIICPNCSNPFMAISIATTAPAKEHKKGNHMPSRSKENHYKDKEKKKKEEANRDVPQPSMEKEKKKKEPDRDVRQPFKEKEKREETHRDVPQPSKEKEKRKRKCKGKTDVKFDKSAFDRLFAGGMKRASDDQNSKRANIQVN